VVGGLVVGGAAVYLAKPSTTTTPTETLTSTSTSTLPPSTVTFTLPPGTVTSTSTTTLPPSTTTSTVTQSASTVTSTVTSTTTSASSSTQPSAFQFFNMTEEPLVAALAEAMIPTDSTGPGAKEAGVIYFLDGQLAGDYGTSANMYFQGPWIQPSTPGPLTVQGITYTGGSAPARLTAGGGYQYPITWQNFWRNCLAYTEAYANSAYGANFENLSAANQAACLTDLWNNKPTNFNGISPQAWFSELHDMVWAGFFTDPLYGGNQGMVGWLLTAFTGTNQGNAYNEGYTTKQLMVMSTPLRLKPQSLTDFQISVGELPQGGS